MTFIPEEDKSGFLAFENVLCNDTFITILYRSPLSESLKISVDEYKLKELKLNRNNKIENLLS